MGLLVWEILFHSFLHYSTWTNDSCCATCCDFTDEVALKLPLCLITYWVWINLYLHLNSLAGLLALPAPLCLMGNGGLSSMIDVWLPIAHSTLPLGTPFRIAQLSVYLLLLASFLRRAPALYNKSISKILFGNDNFQNPGRQNAPDSSSVTLPQPVCTQRSFRAGFSGFLDLRYFRILRNDVASLFIAI